MQLKEKLSATALHERLIEACETERRLPPAKVRPSVTWWPDTLPEWLSYPDPTLRMSLARATAEQIGRYYQILDLVLKAPEADRRVLWAVGHSAAFRQRPRWAKVARLLHTDRRKVKRMYFKAMFNLAEIAK